MPFIPPASALLRAIEGGKRITAPIFSTIDRWLKNLAVGTTRVVTAVAKGMRRES